MKKKIINFLLVVTSLIGYLEWGGGNAMFLFQGEVEVLKKLYSDPIAAAHPFTLLPLFGQLLLIITLFQKEPSRVLTFIGLACLALLLLFIGLIGVLSLELKILASVIPFIAAAAWAVVEYRKK